MTFLYDKINILRESGYTAELPQYIPNNLNPNFELRQYQREAFENFITHYEGKARDKRLQVLFHMATGSGKTLIMAGLMLYLYKRGYRNFLFFVNLSTIVEKTKENFLNQRSAKYLFANEIVIDGEHIKVNQVDNFQDAQQKAINICFSTTQGLHSDIWMAKEDGVTLDDFDDRKIVLISDEAHHLNVDTKRQSKEEEVRHISWEHTVKVIFSKNVENILLEFTATCNLNNAAIRREYENKIVFDYPLAKFYNDKYSKEINTSRSDLDRLGKALQALVVSQYRLKVFEDNRLAIKPVVLFKSKTIDESETFMVEFLKEIGSLTAQQLQGLKNVSSGYIKTAFDYFETRNISLDQLAAELRDNFSSIHCISVNENDAAIEKQIIVNTLEDANNPYRAVFEVKKLDEGWDVLNLFDIVRLYESRESGRSKPSKSTIAEAQLIGRGSRYCPFKIEDEQSKYQRKYDDDITNNLRICETLLYHCQNDSRYISELHQALRDIGLDIDKVQKREYKLKESFKKEKIYTQGLVFLNERKKKEMKNDGLAPSVKDYTYKYNAFRGNAGTDAIMLEKVETTNSAVPLYNTIFTVGQIASMNYAIVNKAIRKYPALCFNKLQTYFPNLKSTRSFIYDENYLGAVKIEIKCDTDRLSTTTLYEAVTFVLGKIAEHISSINDEYIGTREFKPSYIHDLFKDKTINLNDIHSGGLGYSQNDVTVDEKWRMDLSKEDWFAYTDNYGTAEEKALVAYLKGKIKELKKKYSKIFLVRNERAVHIYSFDEGNRFEPDFVMFLQRNKEEGYEQMQIFIEPKGDHLLDKDAWKEKFLLQMKHNAVPIKILADSNDYKIWGLHFFNTNNRAVEFDKDIEALYNGSVNS